MESRRRRWRRCPERYAANFIAVAVALLAGACSSATEPTEVLPAGAQSLFPPAIFETWWQEVEQCSGKTGDFTAITWYYVPGTGGFPVGSDPNVVGLWQPKLHAITLAQYVRENPDVLRHEELHAILNRVDHPAEYFVQKCGSLVTH
jgi:hypothetical protein